MAISSHLLEGIDLSGASGVLVNITAGFYLLLDKFETVGNTICAFISNNATVVIGTSLDNEMNDELLVTMVATVIGMYKRPGITLVTNKTAQKSSLEQRYQQMQGLMLAITPLTEKNLLLKW